MSVPGDDKEIVYNSQDWCDMVKKLLRDKNGDIDEVIRVIATPRNCHRQGARQCADCFAVCLGITPADFMKRWQAMR